MPGRTAKGGQMCCGEIDVERRGAVLLVTFGRGESGNPMDPESFILLASALGRVDEDEELRCGVLAARGDDFTTGLAPGAWRGAARLPPGSVDPLQLDESDRLRVPLVMAVRGRCLGVGFELMLAADVRVASAEASFAYLRGQESYPGGPSLRLPREIGWEPASPFLEGETMTADEAYRLGVVNEVTADGAELERGLYLAGHIADADPAVVAAQLKAFRSGRSGGLKRRMAESLLGAPPLPGYHPRS